MPASAAMRNNMMLGQLLTNDINDKRILAAMGEIPREPFLPEALRGAAYVDEDLNVGGGRYLMEPLTFAKLLDLAEITPECRALVIGSGSGYAAAVVGKLAGQVTAVDSDESQLQHAYDNMVRLHIANVNVKYVPNMADGFAANAPYNVIVIQGAVTFIPKLLAEQLAVGGRLVTVLNVASRPESRSGLGKGLLITRQDHTLQYREHFDASCPVLPGFEHATGFRF